MYCLDLLEMSLTLARHDRTYEDLATKFFEHFALIAEAMHSRGLWDEEDGFYYDVLATSSGSAHPAEGPIDGRPAAPRGDHDVGQRDARQAVRLRGHEPIGSSRTVPTTATCSTCTSAKAAKVGCWRSCLPERLRRVLRWLLDETEFLSPYGVRALSAAHREHPFSVDLGGMTYTVEYDPGESTTGLFGGNSNWRGPIWFPVNYIVIEGIRRFARFFGDDYLVEYPTGSGTELTLDAGCRRARSPADRHLPARRRRSAAGVRHRREVPDRPGLERR